MKVNVLTCRHAICVLIFMGLLAFAPCAQSDITGQGHECTVSNLQTDVRPNADGAPTKVSVGMYMVDLTEISDPNQTLSGDFAVILNISGRGVDPKFTLDLTD